MKVFVILSVLLVATYAQESTDATKCFTDVQNASNCSNTMLISKNHNFMTSCNSITGNSLKGELQRYAENLIEKSYDYLLLSVNFGLYKNNRDGLKAYYRKLSDQTWEDAIDLIKYITKRGGKLMFGEQGAVNMKFKSYSLNEIQSLAKALDIQKSLADEALELYGKSLAHTSINTDGSVAHYLEEKFIEPQMDRVRELAGYFNDLQNMLREEARATAVFMFDEFLKKSL